MSILEKSRKKMFSNKNSETAIFCKILLRIWWYFSQIFVIKIEVYTGETDINLDKKVIQRWFFAISWIECILNYPFYDNFNMSPTHCENSRQIAQIDYLWYGPSKSRANICRTSMSPTEWVDLPERAAGLWLAPLVRPSTRTGREQTCSKIYISLQSNAAWNLLIFIIWR